MTEYLAYLEIKVDGMCPGSAHLLREWINEWMNLWYWISLTLTSPSPGVHRVNFLGPLWQRSHTGECGVLKTTEIHSLWRLRSPKSRCQQGHTLSKIPSWGHLLASSQFLWFAGNPWCSWTCKCIIPLSASVIIRSSPVSLQIIFFCVSVSVALLIRTPVI